MCALRLRLTRYSPMPVALEHGSRARVRRRSGAATQACSSILTDTRGRWRTTRTGRSRLKARPSCRSDGPSALCDAVRFHIKPLVGGFDETSVEAAVERVGVRPCVDLRGRLAHLAQPFHSRV